MSRRPGPKTAPGTARPGPGRRLRASLAATGALLVAVGAGTGIATAQEAPAPVLVTITPVDVDGPTGQAFLSPTPTLGSSIFVYIPGAPAGATVALHAGTCAAIDPAALAQVATDPATGQGASVVPIPMATLTDGSHVIAVHPALDQTTAIACGAIPAGDAVDPAPAPQPQPQPEPVPDAACAAVRAWVDSAKAHLDTIARLEKDANDAAGRGDIQGYLTVVASNMGVVGQMIADLRAQAAPPEAAAAHEQLITALETALESAQLVLDSFQTGDIETYRRAFERGNEASALVLKVRAAIGALEVQCPATPTGG
jgi:hypothetical protein